MNAQIRLYADEACTKPATMIVGGIDYEGTQFNTFAEPTRVIYANQVLERTTGNQTAPAADKFGWENYVCYLPSSINPTIPFGLALYEGIATSQVYLMNKSSATLLNLVIFNPLRNMSQVEFLINDEIVNDYYVISQFRPNEKIKISLRSHNLNSGLPLSVLISYDSAVGPSLQNPQLVKSEQFDDEIYKIEILGNEILVLLRDYRLYSIDMQTLATTLVESKVLDCSVEQDTAYYVKNVDNIFQVYEYKNKTTNFIGQLPHQIFRSLKAKFGKLFILADNKALIYNPNPLMPIDKSINFVANFFSFILPYDERYVVLIAGDNRLVSLWDTQINYLVASYYASQNIIGAQLVGNWIVLSAENKVELVNVKDFSVNTSFWRMSNQAPVVANEDEKFVFIDNQVIDLNFQRPRRFGILPLSLGWIKANIGLGVLDNTLFVYVV